jgi:hypothetical protein
MLRRILITVVATTVMVTAAQAQQTPPAATKQEKPAAPPPAPPVGLPKNVRIELTINDQAGPGESAKRTVSMIVADRKSGSIRSVGQVVLQSGRYAVILNVDATPVIIENDRMRLDIGIEYAPKPGSENASSGEGRSTLNERLGLLVDSGKPMLISQAADPTSDRRISVELTATILK